MDYSFSFHSLEHFFVIVAWSCFPSLWHLPSISALWHIFNWQPTIENIVEIFFNFSDLFIHLFWTSSPRSGLPQCNLSATQRGLNFLKSRYEIEKEQGKYICLNEIIQIISIEFGLFLKDHSGFIPLVQWTMRKCERLRDETACDNIMNISFSKEREEYLQRARRISEESVKKI